MQLRSKLFLVYALPLLLMLSISMAIYAALRETVISQGRVTRSAEIMSEANALLSDVAQAQSGKRGFLLTGDERVLAPYTDALAHFEVTAAKLQGLVADNSEQHTRVSNLVIEFREWVTLVAEPAIREKQRATRNHVERAGVLPDGVVSSVRMGEPLMSRMRMHVREFIRAREELLHARSETSARTLRRTRLIALFGPLIAGFVAILGASLFASKLSSNVHSVVSAVERFAAGSLDQRAAVVTRDEVGRMAAAFNVMAAQVGKTTRQLHAINRLNDLLQACSTTEETIDVVVRCSAELFRPSSGVIYLYDEDKLSLSCKATWGLNANDVLRIAPNDCWALRRGRGYAVEDSEKEVLCPHLPETRPISYRCVPLIGHGETLGLIYVSLHNQATATSPAEEKVDHASLESISSVADSLAMALSSILLRDRLREQSIRDTLTGLHNRRYLEESFERELSRARRNQEPLSVLLLDVDHFKNFNDDFGHDAGDAVLREIADILSSSFRASDLRCRLGGEEFLVVLPGASPDAAAGMADKLRETIRGRSVSHEGRSLGRVSASIGLASYPINGSTFKSLLKAADAALYAAKANGRDCTIVATAELLSPFASS